MSQKAQPSATHHTGVKLTDATLGREPDAKQRQNRQSSSREGNQAARPPGGSAWEEARGTFGDPGDGLELNARGGYAVFTYINTHAHCD